MARMRPPMSGMCEVVAAKATSRSPWKIGFTRQTSLMWPVPCQGSLVMKTSPGFMPSAPNSPRKWRTVAGSVPMKDGMLPEFWASAKPRASVSTQAKSLASLESVEKDVRTMALAASSTTEMSRVQSTSSVMASKRVRHGRTGSVRMTLPVGATRAVAPGPTTSVEPSSSRTAGPWISSPTPRR